MNKPVKIIALLLFAGAAVLMSLNLFAKVGEASHGLPPVPRASAISPTDSTRLTPFGTAGPDGNGPLMSAKERQDIADEIGLTKDQQDKIDAIFQATPGATIFDRMKRLQDAQAILTPQQIPVATKIMSAHFRAGMDRRMAEAKKRMGADDFVAYQRRAQKVRERLAAGQAPFPGMPAPPQPLAPERKK